MENGLTRYTADEVLRLCGISEYVLSEWSERVRKVFNDLFIYLFSNLPE